VIVVVDYGMGNLRSIQYKIEKLGIDVRVTSQAQDIETAAALILPGVGHFARGMRNLRELGLIDPLNEAVKTRGVPIMGICLGLQLFTAHSEEGDSPGLGWLDAETRRFDFSALDSKLTVPHVGWEELECRKRSRYFEGVQSGQRFYFTHSYHVLCRRNEDVLSTTHYGTDFVSAVERRNIFGTQFHPEKSHLRGFRVVENFARSVQAR